MHSVAEAYHTDLISLRAIVELLVTKSPVPIPAEMGTTDGTVFRFAVLAAHQGGVPKIKASVKI